MDATLDPRKYTVLTVLGWVSSSLSLLGSICIVAIAFRRLDRVFHRIMICLSMSDVVLSTTTLLQPLLIPEDVSPLYRFARGNTASCSALGFMMRFPAAVALFNCYLSIYFNQSVRNGWREDKVNWMEFGSYFAAFLVPISFGVAGVLTESFNFLPVLHICEYSAYPTNCEKDDAIECERGSTYLIQDWIYVTIILLVTCVSVMNTFSLYTFVRRQIRASVLNSFDFDPGDEVLVRKVANQSILYTVAYLNGTFWAILTRIVFDVVPWEGRENDPVFFSLAVLGYTFFPLQGFWNSFLYIRPRFLLWRSAYPNASFFWTLRLVLSSRDPVTRRRSRAGSAVRSSIKFKMTKENHAKLTQGIPPELLSGSLKMNSDILRSLQKLDDDDPSLNDDDDDENRGSRKSISSVMEWISGHSSGGGGSSSQGPMDEHDDDCDDTTITRNSDGLHHHVHGARDMNVSTENINASDTIFEICDDNRGGDGNDNGVANDIQNDNRERRTNQDPPGDLRRLDSYHGISSCSETTIHC